MNIRHKTGFSIHRNKKSKEMRGEGRKEKKRNIKESKEMEEMEMMEMEDG